MNTTSLREELVVTLEHFVRAAVIRNAWIERHPLTPEEMKTYTEENPDVPRRRALLLDELGDQVYCSVTQAHWAEDKDNFSWAHAYVPSRWTRELADSALQWAVTHASALGATKIQCWIDSYRESQTEWILDQGFTPGQINPVTIARLQELPLDELAAQHPVPEGLKLMNLVDLREAFPDQWKKIIYDHDMLVMADVPLPSPFVPPLFEQYCREHLDTVYFTPETTFLLMEGDVAVCSTGYHVNLVNSKIASTGLTGTLRDHRRKGLARIIKIASMRAARDSGVAELETDNEQDNPMLQLNFELGFRQEYVSTHYSRAIAE